MIDVLRLARKRRDELSRELAGLDDFVRTAEELLSDERRRRPEPRVNPFQARFNSGEVLPSHLEDEGEWTPVDAEGVFVRAGPGGD